MANVGGVGGPRQADFDAGQVGETAQADQATAPAGLGLGSRGPEVQEAQTLLTNAGFDTGGADGVFGRMTQSAVSQFQRAKGMASTGSLDQGTLAALRKAGGGAQGAGQTAGQSASQGATQTLPTGRPQIPTQAPSQAAAGTDAKAVEDLLKSGDPDRLASDFMKRFSSLVGNVQMSDTAPPMDKAQVARFQSFLGQIEKDGKLGDLRSLLAQADMTKLPGSLMPGAVEFYAGVLVNELGTDSQCGTWGPIDAGEPAPPPLSEAFETALSKALAGGIDERELENLKQLAANDVKTSGNPGALYMAYSTKFAELPEIAPSADKVIETIDGALLGASNAALIENANAAIKKLGDYFKANAGKLPAALKDVDPKTVKLADLGDSYFFGDSYFVDFKYKNGKAGAFGDKASQAMFDLIKNDKKTSSVSIGGEDDV